VATRAHTSGRCRSPRRRVWRLSCLTCPPPRQQTQPGCACCAALLEVCCCLCRLKCSDLSEPSTVSCCEAPSCTVHSFRGCTGRVPRRILAPLSSACVDLTSYEQQGNSISVYRWNGQITDYLKAEPEGGPDAVKATVLLVHGFGAFAEHWRRNVVELAAKGYRCAVVVGVIIDSSTCCMPSVTGHALYPARRRRRRPPPPAAVRAACVRARTHPLMNHILIKPCVCPQGLRVHTAWFWSF
jgi:hypothetical protein